MLNKLDWATPSRIFISYWIAFLLGILLGGYFSVPLEIGVWATIVWALILWSGQTSTIELLSAIAFGLCSGFLLFQVTGGNTWFHAQWLNKISTVLVNFRGTVVSKITDVLPPQSGGLLSGIIFGNVVKLDPKLTQDFRIVGLTHLIAVSGYNLTILTVNIRSLLRPLIGRRSNFVALLVIISFVILTGAPASILRAGVLACLVLLAETVGRPLRPVYLLLLTAGVLAIFQPKIITNVGFLLSFVATYGLMRLGPLVDLALEKIVPFTTLRQVLSETLSATIMTLPIIVAVFGRLSIVSPLSNLLVLPLIPLLMGLGLIGCFSALFIPIVGNYFLLITGPLLNWIIWVTTTLASWPYAALNTQLSSTIAFGICAVIILATEIFYALPISQKTFDNATDEPAFA